MFTELDVLLAYS